MTNEEIRLQQSRERRAHWKRWGPYLSERAWGTVREDYSPNGAAWDYLPHDQARSKAYRWGEDGIGGISDRHQLICFAAALWNGRDRILKERMFGLTGSEGNHGEDVKEYYFYLDSTPTHACMDGPCGPLTERVRRTGSGQMMTLWEVAAELSRRLTRIFLRDSDGRRPVFGGVHKFQTDPNWNDLILFHEYFHGDAGSGVGASHQTGWTGLVAKLIQQSGE